MKEKIGNRIKYLREELGLTQKELASRLNLSSETAIANYESGYSIPKDDIKFKMCSLFNCSLDYLMCLSDERNSSSFNNDDLHIALSKEDKGVISDELKDKITEYAKFVIEQEKNKKDK